MAVIKTAIELEDRISQPLADISRSMEMTARQINSIGTSGPSAAASGLNQYFVSMKNATSAGADHIKSVNGLTTGYRVMNLALREAGYQVGGFRALSMAASTGVVGLSVAIGATILVALGKLSDAAAQVKQRLVDMVGPDMGGKLAGQFKQSEQAAGSASGAMSAANEALVRAVEASKNANGQWQTSLSTMGNLSNVTKIWSERIQLGKVNAD